MDWKPQCGHGVESTVQDDTSLAVWLIRARTPRVKIQDLIGAPKFQSIAKYGIIVCVYVYIYK